jgi:hypothetical protein
MKVTNSGIMARFNEWESFLFHSFVAASISEALRRTIRQSTTITLRSDTPIVVLALTADVVKADFVLKMEDSISLTPFLL